MVDRRRSRQWARNRRLSRVGRRRRTKRWVRRRRPGALLVGAGAVVVVLALAAVGGALGYRSLTRARTSLDSARQSLDQVAAQQVALVTPTGRSTAATELTQALTTLSQAGTTLRSSLPLSLGQKVPIVGTQLRGLMQLVDDANTATTTGQSLLSSVSAASAPAAGGHLPLAQMADLQAAAARDAATLAGLVRSPSGLLGPIASARASFDAKAAKVGTELSDVSHGLTAALPLLGADGPRTYLIAAQNNAEMRDQGMVLSYAIVHVDAGRVSVTHPDRITALALTAPVNVPLSPGAQAVFGPLHPRQLWQSVNATADFADSGATMAAMYAKATGQPVDGVLGLDVPALADILSVVGPVSVPAIPQPVTAANAATILLHDLYAQQPYGDQAARHEETATVASAAINLFQGGQFDLLGLARALGQAAAGRHLLLWAAAPQEEATIEAAGLGGSPAAVDADRTFHVAVENATATKLDYYVQPSLSVQVIVTPLGNAVVRTAVSIANHAPAGAAPSYQLGPDGVNSFQPGQYVARVYLWGPAGSQQLDSVADAGLRLDQNAISVLPGQTDTLNFETVIRHAVRHGNLDLRFVPQPRLFPVPLSVHVDAPRWEMDGPAQVSALLDHTLVLTWPIHH